MGHSRKCSKVSRRNVSQHCLIVSLLKRENCRTICIIFGVQLMLDVDFNVAGGECGGYSQLPLPSGRELWETVSNDEWAARYRKLHARYRDDNVLNIQDLRRARRALESDITDQSEEGRLVGRVAEWCESLDELGMMVWMAVMQES